MIVCACGTGQECGSSNACCTPTGSCQGKCVDSCGLPAAPGSPCCPLDAGGGKDAGTTPDAGTGADASCGSNGASCTMGAQCCSGSCGSVPGGAWICQAACIKAGGMCQTSSGDCCAPSVCGGGVAISPDAGLPLDAASGVGTCTP